MPLAKPAVVVSATVHPVLFVLVVVVAVVVA